MQYFIAIKCNRTEFKRWPLSIGHMLRKDTEIIHLLLKSEYVKMYLHLYLFTSETEKMECNNKEKLAAQMSEV
jgi:hypothetical protein